MSVRAFLTAADTRVALLASLIAALAFLYVFPLFTLAVIFLFLPGVTDIVWAIASFPVQVLGLELPKNNQGGYTLVIAARFYAPFVFVVVFVTILRTRKRRDT